MIHINFLLQANQAKNPNSKQNPKKGPTVKTQNGTKSRVYIPLIIRCKNSWDSVGTPEKVTKSRN